MRSQSFSQGDEAGYAPLRGADASAAPLRLEWRGVGVVVGRAKRSILVGATGAAASGRLVALLGPSGAGKTTLLSVLASRQPADAGDVRVIGDAPGRVRATFVEQDDVFAPELTAREHLVFRATLRGGNQTSLGLRDAFAA